MSQRPSPASSRPENPSTTTDLEADLPGFTPPATRPASPDDPPASPSHEGTTQAPSGWAFADEPDSLLNDDELAVPSSRRRKSSPVSTDPSVFVGLIVQLIKMVTTVLHLRLAPTHVPNDVWLADQEDLDNIAPPLARIAARHSPLDGGPAGDVGDAIEAILATGGYALKNTAAARELRMTPGWEQQHEQHTAAAPEPPAAAPFRPFPVPGE